VTQQVLGSHVTPIKVLMRDQLKFVSRHYIRQLATSAPWRWRLRCTEGRTARGVSAQPFMAKKNESPDADACDNSSRRRARRRWARAHSAAPHRKPAGVGGGCKITGSMAGHACYTGGQPSLHIRQKRAPPMMVTQCEMFVLLLLYGEVRGPGQLTGAPC